MRGEEVSAASEELDNFPTVECKESSSLGEKKRTKKLNFTVSSMPHKEKEAQAFLVAESAMQMCPWSNRKIEPV